MARAKKAKTPPAMVQRTATGLAPLSPFDGEKIGRDRPGQVYELVRVRMTRSRIQQSLYWKVLDLVVEATGMWPSAPHLHEIMVRATGYVVPVLNPATGEYEEVRDSTALDAMDPDEHNAFMDAALAKLSEALGIDVLDLLPPRKRK